MASNLSAYSPIPDGSEATPGLWNSRFEQMQKNIASVGSAADLLLGSAVSFAGRIYTNGRANFNSNVSVGGTLGLMPTTSVISGTKNIEIHANDSGVLLLEAPGILQLQSDQFVGFYNGVTQMGTVNGEEFAINSGKTFNAQGPVLLDGSFDKAVPGTAGASGTKGEVRFSANTMYICVATNSWKTTALASWS
jgi:hypothetical protein